MTSPRRTVASTAATGDRKATLEALRDHLAASIDDVDVRYVAPLAKQLADVLRELSELDVGGKGSTLDDLAARRAARGATTSAPVEPATRQQ